MILHNAMQLVSWLHICSQLWPLGKVCCRAVAIVTSQDSEHTAHLHISSRLAEQQSLSAAVKECSVEWEETQECCAQTNAHNSKSSSTSRKLLTLWESAWLTFWRETYVCSPKTDRAMAVQKNIYKTSHFNSCTLRSEDSGIHLNGTFFPWKTLNIMEINGNIEKLCNKNLDRDQAGHFPVGLVSIARKLWEEKPVKKRRNNNKNNN